MTNLPPLTPTLARAACRDEYTGTEAIDNDLWQGANPGDRCTEYGDWVFFWSKSQEKIVALNEHMEPRICTNIELNEWDD